MSFLNALIEALVGAAKLPRNRLAAASKYRGVAGNFSHLAKPVLLGSGQVLLGNGV
jgi:hypothetical protein